MSLLCALLAFAALAEPAPAAASDARDTVMVMTPVVDGASGAALRDQLAQALARAAALETRARVFSSNDIAQQADLAAQQQLAACDSDACISEIGDAMGARYVLFSTLQRLGAEQRLELRLLDVHSGEIVTRASAAARDTPSLLGLVDDVTREVLRTPFPPPPPWTRPAVITGAVGVGVGLLGAAGAGVVAFHYDQVARDAASSGTEKDAAQALGPVLVAGAVAGAVVAVGGAVLVVAGAR